MQAIYKKGKQDSGSWRGDHETSARIINAAALKTLKKHNQNEQQKHSDFASHAGFFFKFILLKTRENN